MSAADYEQLACEALGLRQSLTVPEVGHRRAPELHLGYFRIADAPELVDAIARARLTHVCATWERLINLVNREHQAAQAETTSTQKRDDLQKSSQEMRNLLAQQLGEHGFYTYDQYIKASAAAERRNTSLTDLPGMWPVAARFQYHHRRSEFTPDRAGYLDYLTAAVPEFAELLTRDVPAVLPEDDRTENTYVVAAIGSGKSELLKLLIHPYVQRPDYAAVVVIDPAGDFAAQVAHWREFAESDRLIYLDPFLDDAHTPIFNPLQLVGVDAADMSKAALKIKRVVAQQLLEAFDQIVGEGQGGTFSTNMEAVLMHCLLVLLSRSGSTLADLQRFMLDGKNKDLVEAGCSYPDQDTADFFRDAFVPSRENRLANSLGSTRDAVYKKINRLFSTGLMRQLTCGKSTFNLEQAINERKVIVFNLAKGSLGKIESQAYGRLILATLQGIALRRDRKDVIDRVPCHVFVDECHNYISESVREALLESRKYRVFLTLAQQMVGENMSPAMRRVVTGSTRLKIIGMNEPEHQRDAAAQIPVHPERMAELGRGRFFVRSRQKRPFLLYARTDLADRNNAMSEEAWVRVRADQLARYYRPLAATEEREANTEPAAADVPPTSDQAGDGAAQPQPAGPKRPFI